MPSLEVSAKVACGSRRTVLACPRNPGQSCEGLDALSQGLLPSVSCLFSCEEGARSWAVETGLAPDKGSRASRGEIGAWELSVAGEISEAGCEGDDLYLSPEIQQ